MTLCEKIKSIYSELTTEDFSPIIGTIRLQNDSDGKGDYIAFWNHPTYPKPTDAQLAEIN